MSEYVVCVKAHKCPLFGAVPEGSRWFADDPVVAAKPRNFKPEEAPE